MSKIKQEQLCWGCSKACGGYDCEWVNKLQPVSGWRTATVKTQKGKKSQIIISCPKYAPGRSNKTFANDVGVESLANRIIKDAAQDYKDVLANNGNTYAALEIEKFFYSKWFGMLTGADPQYIVRAIKTMVERERNDA